MYNIYIHIYIYIIYVYMKILHSYYVYVYSCIFIYCNCTNIPMPVVNKSPNPTLNSMEHMDKIYSHEWYSQNSHQPVIIYNWQNNGAQLQQGFLPISGRKFLVLFVLSLQILQRGKTYLHLQVCWSNLSFFQVSNKSPATWSFSPLGLDFTFLTFRSSLTWQT